jgi:peptidyl-prolyl cis-trans isomerase D
MELRDKIEDERTSGKALAEAAKGLGLSTGLIEAVDALGRDQVGAAVDLPERDALLKAVFASDVGADNDVISSRDGAFVWFEILSIDPARERRLDEVKDQVAATWKDDEIAKRLTDRATEIVARIKGGQSFEDAAQVAGLELKRDDKVRRSEPSVLSQGAVARVFGLPVGEVIETITARYGEGIDEVPAYVDHIVTKVLDGGLMIIDDDTSAEPAVSGSELLPPAEPGRGFSASPFLAFDDMESLLLLDPVQDVDEHLCNGRGTTRWRKGLFGE